MNWPEHTPIETLNLSVRATNMLKGAGLETAGRINAASDVQLLSIEGFGRGSLNEVRDKLKSAPPKGSAFVRDIELENARLRGENEALRYALSILEALLK